MTGFQMRSQNRVGIIFDSYFGLKTAEKSLKSQFWPVLMYFSQTMGQILCKLNFETIFGFLSSRRTF